VNLGVLSTKGSLYVTRPTLATYIASRPDLEETAKSLLDVVKSGKVKIETTKKSAMANVRRNAADAALDQLKGMPVAARSNVTVLQSARGDLAEVLERYRGRSRLVIAPARLAADADAWSATVDALQPDGRLALIDATGPATLPPTATGLLTFHAHIVCAATEVYERAADHAGALTDEIALPVALTRLHRDVAVFCRAERDGGAQ
jgi:hypothetical protein